LTWRHWTDWAKKRPATLHLADWLGRGRGRFRVLDRLNPPAAAPIKPALENWEKNDLAAVWIGHATILLRIGEMTVITDPVLSNRVGVGLGLMTGGPRRLIAPALRLKELPKIDLILISHAHFDHLDRPTLDRFDKSIPVVAAGQTRDLIKDLGFQTVDELNWGESLQVKSLKITARKVAHWGARTFYDQHRGFNAYLVESPKHRVLYGGDTAYHSWFRDIGKVDLAIFGIGAYDPYIAAHATPEQALAMADDVKAERILPMHHSTFRLSHEPVHEPIERLMAALGSNPGRVALSEVGQEWIAS